MFAVISDDLTGAAELAGVGLEYGLQIEITSENNMQSKAPLLIINTGSRVLKKIQASEKVKESVDFLVKLKPEWIFKKTDSVLRGHIVSEIYSILNVIQKKKCLIVPANPGMGRKILDRNYLIDGRPINITDFSKDPDTPCKTSDVLEMLGLAENPNTAYLKKNEKIPDKGIFIGETGDVETLRYWAGKVNDEILPAGAAEFFFHLLAIKCDNPILRGYTGCQDFGRTLFVCGSTHKNSRLALEEAEVKGGEICYLPETLCRTHDPHLSSDFADIIKNKFCDAHRIILSVNQKIIKSKHSARYIENAFGEVVHNLLLQMDLNTLVIEGGETAQSVLNYLSINHLYPRQVLDPGVVLMSSQTKNPAVIIIKPGSYHWPSDLWSFN